MFLTAKRGPKAGKTKRGKGSNLTVLADGVGTPLGIHSEAVSPSAVRLLEEMLDSVKVKKRHGKRQRPHERSA
jgi:hypothetical protein